jgi:hypothetical protein
MMKPKEAVMTKIERLRRQAREAAKLKGHTLGRFKESVISGESSQNRRLGAVAACRICGAMAVVDAAPGQDEPEILGEAVEMQCLAIEREGHETA